MKVLIISHTVLSNTNNMGKTLLSYFSSFEPCETAQLYIHSEVPTLDSVCQNYYRFTDIDALKSIIPLHKHGRIFRRADIRSGLAFSRIDTGLAEGLYQRGSRRTVPAYIFRNFMWSLSHWFTEDLKLWLKEFDPDIIFFASGDYAFMYRITLKISEYLNKPLAVSCVDDYYTQCTHSSSLPGRLEYSFYMKSVKKLMARAKCIFTICDSLSEVYQRLFSLPVCTLHTSAEALKLKLSPHAFRISYIGNLGCGRCGQLVLIGRALKSLSLSEGPLMLDVYSAEQDKALLAPLTEDNGIRFHGAISSDQVRNVMTESIAVVHTESFDPSDMKRVRFSVSTKIAESLMYGPCLIAFGPKGIASVDYLRKNNAAYIIDSPDKLCSGLREFIENPSIRSNILINARRLAGENHLPDVNSLKLRLCLESILKDRV